MAAACKVQGCACRLVFVALLACLLQDVQASVRQLVQAVQPGPPPLGSPEWKQMVQRKQYSGLIKSGTVLVKDALSLTNIAKSISNCQAACTRLHGCNAWSLCTAAGGCGQGCAAYAKKNPPLPKDTSGVGRPYWSLATPLAKVGYWTKPKPGGNGCQGDKYAFGTCTLLGIPDPKQPTITPSSNKAVAGGYVSGVLIRHPYCGKTLSTTCSACGLTPNPVDCLACAKRFLVSTTLLSPASKKPILAMLAPTAHQAALDQTACLKCASMPYGRVTGWCIDCVFNRKPCAACAYNKYEPGKPKPPEPDLKSCIACAQGDVPSQYFPAFHLSTITEVCRTCAARSPAQQKICMPWLTAYKPDMCRGAKWAGCIYPEDALSKLDLCQGMPSCRTCVLARAANMTDVWSKCMGCLDQQEADVDCLDCVNSGSRGCLECIGTCYSCGYKEEVSYDMRQFSQSCVECYNNNEVFAPELCPKCENINTLESGFEYRGDYCNDCVRNATVTDYSTCVLPYEP